MRKLVQSAAVCFVACQASLCNGATFTSFDAFQAATQNLTLENFDLAPWPGAQQAGLDGTTNFGIAWTAFGSLWSVTGFSRSGPTSITDSDQSNDADDPHDNITATIGISGVNAFGGFVRAFDGRVTMTAFDGGNVVLGSVQASLASDFTFVGITSDVEIARVEFVARGPVDDFALDDVHFSQIPEPSSAMLAALGLVGLAAFGWRRRKR